jgi:hypothetical protein
MIFIGLTVKKVTKAELPLQSRKVSIKLASTYCLSYQYKQQGVCVPIGNTEIFLVAVYKSPQRLWSDTDVTELFEISPP